MVAKRTKQNTLLWSELYYEDHRLESIKVSY